jgi:uncharacterized protein YhbP (UPF0306 family)
MQGITQLRSILNETHSLTLATVDPDGSPRATPLFFAVDESLDLYFLSDPESQHCLNFTRDPRVAVGLYPDVKKWRHIRGVQMKGAVDFVSNATQQVGRDYYYQRFPFISLLQDVIDKSRFFRFQPSWIRMIDNRQKFGAHWEWDWPLEE